MGISMEGPALTALDFNEVLDDKIIGCNFNSQLLLTLSWGGEYISLPAVTVFLTCFGWHSRSALMENKVVLVNSQPSFHLYTERTVCTIVGVRESNTAHSPNYT